MHNKNIKSLLLEVITEKYGKIEFVEGSLAGKNHLIMPYLQEYHDPNSEILCIVGSQFVQKDIKDERFQLAFEYNIVKSPLKTIYLDFSTFDQKTYLFNYVKEIKDFADKCGIIRNFGMGPVEFKGKMIDGYRFWEEFMKGEEMYFEIRQAVKEYLLNELSVNFKHK